LIGILQTLRSQGVADAGMAPIADPADHRSP
jgi:hypothetical protein